MRCRLFKLTAIARTGSFQTTPDRGGMPQAQADALSGILTVP
jgi:hypothetical protein